MAAFNLNGKGGDRKRFKTSWFSGQFPSSLPPQYVARKELGPNTTSTGMPVSVRDSMFHLQSNGKRKRGDFVEDVQSKNQNKYLKQRFRHTLKNLTKERVCFACNRIFTEAANFQHKCGYHHGFIDDIDNAWTCCRKVDPHQRADGCTPCDHFEQPTRMDTIPVTRVPEAIMPFIAPINDFVRPADKANPDVQSIVSAADFIHIGTWVENSRTGLFFLDADKKTARRIERDLTHGKTAEEIAEEMRKQERGLTVDEKRMMRVAEEQKTADDIRAEHEERKGRKQELKEKGRTYVNSDGVLYDVYRGQMPRINYRWAQPDYVVTSVVESERESLVSFVNRMDKYAPERRELSRMIKPVLFALFCFSYPTTLYVQVTLLAILSVWDYDMYYYFVANDGPVGLWKFFLELAIGWILALVARYFEGRPYCTMQLVYPFRGVFTLREVKCACWIATLYFVFFYYGEVIRDMSGPMSGDLAVVGDCCSGFPIGICLSWLAYIIWAFGLYCWDCATWPSERICPPAGELKVDDDAGLDWHRAFKRLPVLIMMIDIIFFSLQPWYVGLFLLLLPGAFIVDVVHGLNKNKYGTLGHWYWKTAQARKEEHSRFRRTPISLVS